MEYVLQPNSEVGEHHHPAMSQSFEVLSGTLHVRVNGGEVLALNPGDKATTGVDGVHTQWNEGPEPTAVIESYDPPLAIEPFFTVLAHAMASKSLQRSFPFGFPINLLFGVRAGPTDRDSSGAVGADRWIDTVVRIPAARLSYTPGHWNDIVGRRQRRPVPVQRLNSKAAKYVPQQRFDETLLAGDMHFPVRY